MSELIHEIAQLIENASGFVIGDRNTDGLASFVQGRVAQGGFAGVEHYIDYLRRHPDARQVPGLVLFRFDAPLFFANSDHFERCVRAVIDDSPDRVRRLVIAAEPITDIDTSAAAMLEILLEDLQRSQIELDFAELKGPVKDRLIQYGLYEQIGSSHFHSTIGAAVKSYILAHEVDWANWDD